MNQGAEEICPRCETQTEIKAQKKEACVTRFEEVDDVVREESEEQRK